MPHSRLHKLDSRPGRAITLNVPDNSTDPYHPYKAVAIDLDGTLLGPDLAISPENRAAIEELHSYGIRIILASGRHHRSMAPIARSLPQVEWMVSFQGALAANVDQTEILYESYLTRDKLAYALDFGIKYEYSTIAYTQDSLYTLGDSEWTDYYKNLVGMTPEITTKEQILDKSILKVIVLDSEERIDQALQLPEVKAWDEYHVRSLKNIMEFAANSTSKAHALRPLLNHLGIDPNELVTFGDAPNDNPMFKLAGFSVAMSDAWPETKAAAHAVAPDGPADSSFARAVTLMKNKGRSR